MKNALLTICLLLAKLSSVYCQDIKARLLQNVSYLPMPEKDEPGMSVFFTTNEIPEIIALTKVEVGAELRAPVIMATVLDKGRILLIGSPSYFGSTQLKHSGVAQLLKNAMALSGQKPRIGIVGDAYPDLVKLMKSAGAQTYQASSGAIKDDTDILVVSKDLRKQIDIVQVEYFVRNGGMLWFASPNGELKKNTSDDDKERPELLINSLLAKAGAYNYNMVIKRSATNTTLSTDTIPEYLHIKTLLPWLAKKKDWFERNADYYIVNPMLENVFKYNDRNAPVMKKIKAHYHIPDSIRIPTAAHPMMLPSDEHKAGFKLLNMFYDKAMDFKSKPGSKAGGHEDFPGPVPATAPRENETVHVPVKVGTQGLIDPPSVYYRAHSTGYYIPAGEKVKITLDKSLLKMGLIAQIGVHGDNVMHLDKVTRYAADLVRKFNLEQETTEIYSPFGGLLLLNIPDIAKQDTIIFNIEGAVKAPYFKLGETSEADWLSKIRNYPGPWAELATNNIVLTVPSYRIRKLDNPEKLMKFWDEVMDANAELAVIDNKRVHQERIIVDRDVAYGYMFTTWDRIVVPDDQSCEWMLNEEFIRKNGSWGTFHELGHRHQFGFFDFPGTGEVTENLYTMYVYDKVLGKGLFNHDNLKTKSDVMRRIKTYLADNPSYEKWSEDPFLALSMYVQLIDRFGWESILNVHKAYRTMPTARYPKSDQDKRDTWFLHICKSTNSNLARFFEVWKVPVSDEAKKKVSNLTIWFPEELYGF